MAIFDQKLILLDFETTTKEELFKKITDVLLKAERILDTNTVCDALWQREAIVTTGIGHGVAIPHARSVGVIKPTVLFARLKKAIDYNSLDNEPIDLVFMIAMPEDSGDLHLKVLSKIAIKLLDETLMNQFRNETEPNKIFTILSEIEEGV